MQKQSMKDIIKHDAKYHRGQFDPKTMKCALRESVKTESRKTSGNVATTPLSLDTLNAAHIELDMRTSALGKAVDENDSVKAEQAFKRVEEMLEFIKSIRGMMPPTKFNSATGLYFFSVAEDGKEKFVFKVTETRTAFVEVAAADIDAAGAAALRKFDALKPTEVESDTQIKEVSTK